MKRKGSGLGAGLTKERRKSIYRRDGYACALCGRADGLQIHHVVHRSQGGKDEPWNLVTLCPMCHQLAHGERPVYVGYEYLKDYGWTPEEIRQDIVEYLADLYINEGYIWTPTGPVAMVDERKRLFELNQPGEPEGDPDADDTAPVAWLVWEEPGPGPEVKPLERGG